MNHYVYEITNLVNGKKYIGKRSCNCSIEEDKYMGSGTYLKRAFKKHGKENFKKEILEICITEEEAFEREKFYIGESKAYLSNKYYNISSGGDGGFANFAGKSQDELELWKKRMSESRKGRSMSREWIDKSAKTRIEKGSSKGKNNGMYGKKGKDNPASKAIIMMNLEGNIVKEFDCIREANDYFNKDRAFSYISRRCISKSGGAYGHMWLFKDDYKEMIKNNTFLDWAENNSKITQRAISAFDYCNNKPVYQLDQNTLSILKRYESIQEAKNITGIGTQSIIRNCKHGSNKTGGFSWILVEEYESITKEELKRLYSKKSSIKPK